MPDGKNKWPERIPIADHRFRVPFSFPNCSRAADQVLIYVPDRRGLLMERTKIRFVQFCTLNTGVSGGFTGGGSKESKTHPDSDLHT